MDQQMIFKSKEQPKLEESVKMYGSTPLRKISIKDIKKTIAKCELSDDKDKCRKFFKDDLGIEVIEDV